MLSDTEENWKSRMEAWGKSGLSQKAYCREEKISFSAFYYWKKKLSKNEHQFVELKFKQTDSSCSPITIRLPNGIRIDINQNQEPEIIERLVLSLKGII